MLINKVFVGSGHRDVPKYVGEGVASHGPPGNLGGPGPRFAAVFRQFHVNALQIHHL